MISELVTAAASVKALNDILKASLELHTFNQVVAALSKVNADLMSAQAAALKAQDEQAQLAKKVLELEEQLAATDRWNTIAQHYKLRALVPGVYVYEYFPVRPGEEPYHFACVNCFDRRERAILQRVASDDSGETYECSRCKTRINADNPNYHRETHYAQRAGNPLMRWRR